MEMTELKQLEYCECCGKPMQILFTREYVENEVKEEREKYAQALERIINRAQLNTPGRTSKIVEIATDALQEKSNADED